MATVRQDNVQLRVDLITDESRQLAKAITQTDQYQAAIVSSTKAIEAHKKELAKVAGDEAKRAELLKKIADREADVAKNMKAVADEAKKVQSIDLSRLTPAQLIQRARQLATAIRDIPQSAPEYAQLNAELKRTNQQLTNIRETSKGISSNGGGGGLLAKGAGIIGGITALVGSVSGIVSATRETEKLFAVLKNSVGNDAAALRIFDELQRFAATTPFALNEVVGSFNKLQQRNFNPTIAQLKAIGDIAASQGKSIDQFVEAVLDAQTGEFERLKEFGIVARKEGDNVTATFRGQSQTFKLTSDNIKEYLLGIGQLPGVLGSTDSVAQTLDGSLSNLGDNFDQLFATIGGGGGILKGVVDFLNQIVGSVTSFLKQPLSDKLREQQSEFNALVNILKDVNVSEDTRNRAIAQLQRDYPDYIGNIDLQKASEADLNKVLETGNALFTKRVFLQSQNEKLEQFAKNQLSFQKLIFDTEKRLQEAQNRPDSQRGFFDKSQATEIRTINGELFSYRKTLEGINKEQQDFVIEQEKFAKQFGIDLTEDPAAPPKSPKSGPSAVKKDAQAAAGSLAYLRDEISKLQKEIEATPGDSKALAPLITELRRAEKELKSLEERIANLKNPQAELPPSLQEITAQLGGGGGPSPDALASEDARAALVAATNDFIVQDEAETLDQIDQLRTQAAAQELERQAEQLALRRENREVDAKELRDLEIQAAEAAASVFFQAQQQKLQTETQNELAALDKQYAARIKAAEGNAAEQERLQRELEQKKEQIELAAARKRKALALKEAIVQGALAVVKALPNIASAIAAGIAAAAQIAVIASQKFAQGGIAKFGYFGGRPHSAGGTKGYFDDGTRIEVEKDEAFAIVNKRNAPLLRMLSNINALNGHGVPFFQKGGIVPRFDAGGLTSVNTTPVSTVALAAGAAGVGNLDIFMSAVAEFGAVVRAFPREVKSRVVYTDLESKAKELGDVRDDASF